MGLESLKGMQVDRITGRPIENIRQAKEAEEEKRLESFAIEGAATEKKLNTDDGKFFITLILKLLETRMDQLAAEDTQVQSILAVLDGLGLKIAAGRSASERLTKRRLRTDQNMSLGSTE